MEERDGANKGPRAQERAQRAESPRAACIAQRRTREGSLARVASDAAPHGRAAEEGGSLHREESNERQTARGEIDSHYHPRTLFGCGGESRQTA